MSVDRTPLRDLLAVAAGGAIGALARVALATWFPAADGAFPWTTFLENVSGALLLSFAVTLLAERVSRDPTLRLFVCTGALGAFTTFSTLALELDLLLTGTHLAVAGAYAAASLTAGLVGAVLGHKAARIVVARGSSSHPSRGSR